MIDFTETGPCRTKTCTNTGRRARGAKDIEPMATRTGVFDKSFYCDDCHAVAAQRSFMHQTLGVRGGLLALMWRNDREN